MAGAQHLLRKAALEKMSSPEQLDMAMRVTSPASWVALSALGSLIFAAVVYSVVGTLSVKVDGTGILLRGDEVRTIQGMTNGVLTELEAATGDLVEEGQIVARLDIPDIESEIRMTRDRIADLSQQQGSRESQMETLRRSYQRQLNDLYARRKNIEGLVEKQIKTRNDLTAIDAQIAQIRAQMMQSTMGEDQQENQLAEQERTLTQLEERLAQSSVVRSPHRGQITAILKSPGQVISQGERLMNLEDPEADLEVLLFVPFAEGKKIAPGMKVRISPSTVKPEEFGFIIGTIQRVSSQPVTPEEVRTTLNNDQLANKFAQDTPFAVRAVPDLDPSTASGLAWTSSSGPPHQIAANTPVTAQIIVDERRPISYVIPTIKKSMGMSG